jgi:uncharacterized membrane protein
MATDRISHLPDLQPTPLRKLRRTTPKIKNVNQEHQRRLSQVDRLALFITERVGSMGFFAIILTWTVCWLSWNILAPSHLRFDPFPGFILWLFISNMVQIMLMPLIMVGQNLQGRHSEARAENDFEVNVKAEREIEAVLEHLEYQNNLILEILTKVEKLEVKSNSRPKKSL